jgi:hypothetical protein
MDQVKCMALIPQRQAAATGAGIWKKNKDCGAVSGFPSTPDGLEANRRSFLHGPLLTLV